MTCVIDEMLHNMAKWLSSDGKDSDIVISSRARLARNLQNVLFEDQLKTVLDTVLKATENTETLGSTNFFDMSTLNGLDRQFFAERRLISTEFIEKETVRFSVFIHLPVLTLTKQIEDVFAETIPAGIAVRGFYGEGSKVIGNFFQISNQYTLGWTAQGILNRVTPLIERFISLERKARETAMCEERIIIEDKIYRALGLISHARILSSMEFLDLISALRLGADLGILTKMEKKPFNELMVLAQPAHIQN